MARATGRSNRGKSRQAIRHQPFPGPASSPVSCNIPSAFPPLPQMLAGLSMPSNGVESVGKPPAWHPFVLLFSRSPFECPFPLLPPPSNTNLITYSTSRPSSNLLRTIPPHKTTENGLGSGTNIPIILPLGALKSTMPPFPSFFCDSFEGAGYWLPPPVASESDFSRVEIRSSAFGIDHSFPHKKPPLVLGRADFVR